MRLLEGCLEWRFGSSEIEIGRGVAIGGFSDLSLSSGIAGLGLRSSSLSAT